MIAVIGNAPSSGSTFLADLLDSTPITACGVELNLFSNKSLYHFCELKKERIISSPSSSIYKTRNRLNIERLHSYGLNILEFNDIFHNSTDLDDFAENLARHYLSLRGKDTSAVWVEKTPENINCIGEFLEAFPNSFFIHIVRNPLYVAASLLKRGFPPYIALGTWLIDEANFLKYRESPNVITISYESLVRSPFRVVSELVHKITGSYISSEDIQRNYENNSYRRLHSKKIHTWSIDQYGTIGNANNRNLEKSEVELMQCMWHMKVNTLYSKHFSIRDIDFISAVKILGYYDEIESILPKLDSTKYPSSFSQRRLLLSKWWSDCLSRNASLKDLMIYLNPIVFTNKPNLT